MKKIVVCGVGALGSHLILGIREIPDVSITAIDFDHVESKNTQSQFHPKISLRKNKALAIHQTMNFLFGAGPKIHPVPHRLTSDNVNVLLSDASLVVDCFDNAESRHLVQTFARKNSIPCVHGAVDANGTYGRVCWTENFRVDQESQIGQATCEGGENLPFLMIVSAYLARSVQVFFQDGSKVGFEIPSRGGSISCVTC